MCFAEHMLGNAAVHGTESVQHFVLTSWSAEMFSLLALFLMFGNLMVKYVRQLDSQEACYSVGLSSSYTSFADSTENFITMFFFNHI